MISQIHNFSLKRLFNRNPTLQPWKHSRQRYRMKAHAFQIDHRHHMNLSWERQNLAAELLTPSALQASLTQPAVVSIKDLSHLEMLLDVAGGRLAVLYLYTTSCGVCKEMQRLFKATCQESHKQKARTVFLEHDVNDEYDSLSDLARYYRVKAVPRFLFFIDGALVRTMTTADIRSVKNVSVANEHQKLRAILFELLIKNAPSSRR
jgi:thiol-disulfide isomerase/thioredoxin